MSLSDSLAATTLRIAFASGDGDTLFDDHFGHAPRYRLFDCSERVAAEVAEVPNPKGKEEAEAHQGGHHHAHEHADHDEHPQRPHGIGQTLRPHGVQVVVGRAFGPNIQRMKQQFAPVLVRSETVSTAIQRLQDEWPRIVAVWEAGAERRHLVLR